MRTFKILLLISFMCIAASSRATSQNQITASRSAPALADATPVVYKVVNDVSLRLYIYQPGEKKSKGDRAAIVFFFGGGWVAGRIEQFQAQAMHLAGRGMVAILADYRVKSRHGTTPFEAIADGKSAIRWVRAHAKELRVNTKRIAAAGGSAGGHVAASAATLKGFDTNDEDQRISSIPDALVLFNPVVDTTASGYGANTLGTLAEEASPLHHLTKGVPPTIIFHGTADKTVPFGNVAAFCERMKKLNNRCELIPYEGKGHGFFNASAVDRESYLDTLQKADQFLVSLGYLRP